MTEWALWGTVVNAFLVLLGAVVGLVFFFFTGRRGEEARVDAGSGRGASLQGSLQKAMGLCVLLIGIAGALNFKNILVVIISVALGTLVGELLNLDTLLCRFGDFVERKMTSRGGRISEGFVAATLLFCVGAMTVTGAIEGALMHTHTTYYAKGMIDMVCAVIFATTMGIGVLLSAVSVLVVQGGLVLLVLLVGGELPPEIVSEIMAVGSLLVISIGTNLMGVTKIKVMNLVPSMFFPIAVCPLLALFS